MENKQQINLAEIKLTPELQQQLANFSEWQRELVLEAAQFFIGLLLEGERAAVVLGAARIDVALERLLKAVMQHHAGGSDNLFDPDRPLGTFSAKIALSHRLGLIDDHFEHALQMLRKIRNDFAHSVVKSTLSESAHRNRVMELAKVTKKSKDQSGESFHTFLSQLISSHIESTELREFCTSIYLLVMYLEFAAASNERFVPQRQAKFL